MADNYMGRGRVIEFEDESESPESRDLRQKAQWLIYDFAASENVPIIDILNFKSANDAGEKTLVAFFSVKDALISVTACTDQCPVTVNGETVTTGQVKGLQVKDVVEFLECKYLVNANPNLTQSEVRQILGQQVIVRTTQGLKTGLQNKDEQYKNLRKERDDCKQLVEISKMKLKDAASKKELMATLKQQFMICKAQVEEIESQNLPKIIEEHTLVLQELENQVSKMERELSQMKDALERREKMENERRKQLMERDLAREEEELRLKLEGLQKKRKNIA